jgi:hypothetical protein
MTGPSEEYFIFLSCTYILTSEEVEYYCMKYPRKKTQKNISIHLIISDKRR